MPTAKRDGDHDLLVRIDENLKNLKGEFSSFRDATQASVALKANQTEITRLEAEITAHGLRLEKAEHFMWGAFGIVGFVELIAGAIVAIHYWPR